jgi:uncharacterized Zn finger protein (UPF0148 family)
MSDFDKEAEREKLRKKYADDEDDRADTKRMSELLLKGATMTNQHCDTCGDPLFSHNDRTFCPTCQADSQQSAAQSDGTQQPTPEQSGDADQQQPPNAELTPEQPANSTPQPTQSTPTHPATNGQPTQADTQSETNRSSATQSSPPTATQSSPPTATQSSRSRPQSSQSPTQSSQSTPQPSSPATAGDSGLRDARQSLAATVTRFSQRAAETDDPRRAKELLSAAREAAETLRALEFN